jgi:hypothetical protein
LTVEQYLGVEKMRYPFHAQNDLSSFQVATLAWTAHMACGNFSSFSSVGPAVRPFFT